MNSGRKKVLILTYYWPPYGDVGSHRWVKFVKHLRKFGWEPVVFTAQQSDFPIVDKSLLNNLPQDIEVHKVPIWEPYVLYRRLLGLKKTTKSHSGFLTHKNSDTLLNRVALWIRGNIFVPDARIFWVRPAAKYLRRWLTLNKVDAIVSTGTPHSTHLIAQKLKKTSNLPWLADFRDLWTRINYYDKIQPISWVHSINEYMERSVLNSASHITTVSTSWSKELQKMTKTPVSVVHNGYDIADFGNSEMTSDHMFRICHTGYMTLERNCGTLWKVLADLCESNKAFGEACLLELYGVVDERVLHEFDRLGLTSRVLLHGYLDHAELVPLLRQKNVLLLSVGRGDEYTKGWIPAKLFEYMAAGRPILSFGREDGDCNDILKEHGNLPVMDYASEKETKAVILELFSDFQLKKERILSTNTSSFEREKLTKKICQILDEITENERDTNIL